MQFYFSSLIQSQKNMKNLYTKVYFHLTGEGYCILWWTILGLRWSQSDVCGLGYTHNAQKGCFSPKGTISSKHIVLIWWQGFSGFPWIAAKTRPNGLLPVLDISRHSPVFPRDGCIFRGRQSKPWVLSASLCSLRGQHWSQVTRVITGITCHLLSPSLYFLSLECISLKWTWSFAYCSVQPSTCECAQTSLSILLFLLRSASPFCHKLLHFPVHPLCMWPQITDTGKAGGRRGVSQINYLVLFCWYRQVASVQEDVQRSCSELFCSKMSN